MSHPQPWPTEDTANNNKLSLMLVVPPSITCHSSLGFSTSLGLGPCYFQASESHRAPSLHQGVKSCVTRDCSHIHKFSLIKFYVLLPWSSFSGSSLRSTFPIPATTCWKVLELCQEIIQSCSSPSSRPCTSQSGFSCDFVLVLCLVARRWVQYCLAEAPASSSRKRAH